MIRNTASPEGFALGANLARFADAEIAGLPCDKRCATCAFRKGTHLANGSVPTLMNALKCVIEGVVFRCHEHDAVCAGYAALAKTTAEQRAVMAIHSEAGFIPVGASAPWDFIEGHD